MTGAGWYKDAVFYELDPRAFEGEGGLVAARGRLDYVASLGVTAVRLGPVYPTARQEGDASGRPRARARADAPAGELASVDSRLGTVEDFDAFLTEAHDRGLRVVLDLAVGRTSAEHPWFGDAVSDSDSPYRDYYVIRKGRRAKAEKVAKAEKDGHDGSGAAVLPPNNWDSLAGGSAWGRIEGTDDYYLHALGANEPDLDLTNPDVLEELERAMRFWLDRGADGLCLDGLTLAGRPERLPDDRLALPGSRGMRYLSDGPRVGALLRRLEEDVLGDYDCLVMTVAPGIQPRSALRYLRGGRGSGALDLVLHPATRVQGRGVSLRQLKRELGRWQDAPVSRAWDALCLEGPELPHAIGRHGGEAHRVEMAKMLAVSYLFRRGTPFVGQGEELGLAGGVREDSRVAALEVAEQDQDLASVLSFYRQAIRLRRFLPVVCEGGYHEFKRASGRVYLYAREGRASRLLVICSFSDAKTALRVPAPYGDLTGGVLALANYYVPDPAAGDSNELALRPYEARVYVFGADTSLVD